MLGFASRILVHLRVSPTATRGYPGIAPIRCNVSKMQWSAYFNRRGPDSDVETLEFFAKRVGDFNKNREDVTTWFDLLDLDDYVTFGGRA
jgi:hypothetical protein